MTEESFKRMFPDKVYLDSLKGFLAAVREKGTPKGFKYYNGYDMPANMQQAFEQGKVYVQNIV